MKTADFDYDLPSELIAQTPAPRRDDARLLVVDRQSRSVEHRRFRDLPEYLKPGDCLIRNTARVIPARLFAQRPGGGRVECFLLRAADGVQRRWWCLLRPGRKLPPGSRFGRAGEFQAQVLEKNARAEYLVEFQPDRAGESVVQLAGRLGVVPLPPYIHRDAPTLPETTADADNAMSDAVRYQTVFADATHTVAVAAPTAGLHFTPELLAVIEARGVELADVVLHVGLATFRPMEVENVADHPIHRETVEVPAAAQRRLALPRSGRRIAVGTTSVRTIEYFARNKTPSAGSTPPEGAFVAEADLFIHPPFEFRSVDALITNFHLPRSTLLCLVAAFLAPGSTDGVTWIKDLYAEAVRRRYRFLSYGDAMLIL